MVIIHIIIHIIIYSKTVNLRR